MHLCPDEIIPALSIFGAVPFVARWAWHKLTGRRLSKEPTR